MMKWLKIFETKLWSHDRRSSTHNINKWDLLEAGCFHQVPPRSNSNQVSHCSILTWRHFERLSKHSGFILSATEGVWNEEAAPSKDNWSKVLLIPLEAESVLTEQQLEGCLLVLGARLEHTAEPRLNSHSEHSAVKQKRKKKVLEKSRFCSHFKLEMPTIISSSWTYTRFLHVILLWTALLPPDCVTIKRKSKCSCHKNNN